MRAKTLKKTVLVVWVISAISVILLVTYTCVVPLKSNPMDVGWLKNVRWKPGELKVDIYDFLINPVDTCKVGNRNTTLLILVKSAPSHKSRRETIRETYIKGVKEHNVSARVLFVLGNTEEKMEREGIWEESDLYGDIIQADFIDHYYNLTIKLIMGFKWVTHFCRNSEFVMSMDDDVMLDVFTLVRDLQALPLLNRTNFCLGEPNEGKPIRDATSKWYCPKELYPDDTYPVSPFGAGYVLSQDSVQKLYDASKGLLPEVPFDDVYCGMLLHARGIQIVKRSALYTQLHPERKSKDYLKSQLSVFQMKRAWNSREAFEHFTEKKVKRTIPAKSLLFPFILISVLMIFIISSFVYC